MALPLLWPAFPFVPSKAAELSAGLDDRGSVREVRLDWLHAGYDLVRAAAFLERLGGRLYSAFHGASSAVARFSFRTFQMTTAVIAAAFPQANRNGTHDTPCGRI